MHGPEHWVGLLVAGGILVTTAYVVWQVCELLHYRVLAPFWKWLHST